MNISYRRDISIQKRQNQIKRHSLLSWPWYLWARSVNAAVNNGEISCHRKHRINNLLQFWRQSICTCQSKFDAGIWWNNFVIKGVASLIEEWILKLNCKEIIVSAFRRYARLIFEDFCNSFVNLSRMSYAYLFKYIIIGDTGKNRFFVCQRIRLINKIFRMWKRKAFRKWE